MSLVGTRPPTVDEWDKYELHHRARLATKPGLTGMWQVSGRSNITDLANVFLIIVFSFIAKLLMPETWIGIIGVGLIMVVIGVPIYMLITYRIEEIKEKYKLIIKRNKEK